MLPKLCECNERLPLWPLGDLCEWNSHCQQLSAPSETCFLDLIVSSQIWITSTACCMRNIYMYLSHDDTPLMSQVRGAGARFCVASSRYSSWRQERFEVGGRAGVGRGRSGWCWCRKGWQTCGCEGDECRLLHSRSASSRNCRQNSTCFLTKKKTEKINLM